MSQVFPGRLCDREESHSFVYPLTFFCFLQHLFKHATRFGEAVFSDCLKDPLTSESSKYLEDLSTVAHSREPCIPALPDTFMGLLLFPGSIYLFDLYPAFIQKPKIAALSSSIFLQPNLAHQGVL